MAMLAHENAWLRAEAAKALGRLYDQQAIKALAKAVDDPDPNVRDAVLASLERIETTEKQKDRWRAYAKDR
jgi:HEAT repeat protein